MNNSKEANLAGIHVLVVDDAPDNRLLVTRFLKIAGATSDSASDGTQGLEKAVSGKCDVVLMDIQMPVMDGYEAVSKLRSMHFDKPVIALTAHAMKSERERCLKSGFDAYLTKPIDRAELFAAIRTSFDDYTARMQSEINPHEDTRQDPDGLPAPQEVHQSRDRIQH
jgi:hypothetical protein